MTRRTLRIVPAAAVCIGFVLTATAAAGPTEQRASGFLAQGSGVGSASTAPQAGAGGRAATSVPALSGVPSGGTARDRLRARLLELDARAATLEQSGDAAAAAQAAKARAAFAAAIPVTGRLTERKAAAVLELMPPARVIDVTDPETSPHAEAASLASPNQGEVAELEQLRAELDQLFVRYASWAYLVPADGGFSGYVQDGRNVVASLTYEELTALRTELADIPNWQSVLAPDLTSLVPPPGGQVVAGDGPFDKEPGAGHTLDGVGAAPLGDGARPNELYPLPRRPSIDMGAQCLLATTVLTLAQLEDRILAVSILSAAAFSFSDLAEILPKDIKIDILSVVITIPANLPALLAKIAAFVIKRVVDGMSAELSVNAYCASTVHWNVLVLHAQSEIDRSQDMLFQELDYYNRMTERYNDLDLTERELWKMQVQLGIEENLLLDAPKADGTDENRIALFQFTDTVCFNPEQLMPTPLPPFDPPVAPTPVDPLLDPCHKLAAFGPSTCSSPIDPPDRYLPLPTLAAFVGPPDPREECGLNLVRRVVDETIRHNQQAGQNIHNAISLLAAGDAFLTSHNYGQAYVRFRQAYQAAVKPDPSPTN